MARVDQLNQPRRVDMRIDFGRRDIGVPQHRLQRAQVSAAFEQVRRKGMAQDVRAHPIGRDPRLRRERLDELVQPDP